ncbi:MAG: aldose 1-epimerase [Chloroflexota bacterium]
MATTSDFTGERAFRLGDGGGAQAWIVPAVGNNCVAFQTPVGGRMAHLLSTPASAEVLRSRPTFWGFPILSPYPGRHQTPFTWQGTPYAITPNDRPGVAIHGIVAGAPWEVLEATEASLTCRFDSETFPNRAERWPWPFTLTTTHRLEDGALRLELELENRADVEVPHLLGLHPYFPVRFTPAGRLGDDGLPTAADLAGDDAAAWRRTCSVWIEGDELWEMKAGLATGTIHGLESGWDLRAPQAVGDLEARLPPPPGRGPFGDDAAVGGPRLPVLLYGKRDALRAGWTGDRSGEAGGVTNGVADLASGVRMTLESSLAFGSLALFCPGGQPFISLEPRSAVSDALTLMNDPRHPPTGVCALAPGARWKAWVRLSASELTEE